jgi:hypothetical protein
MKRNGPMDSAHKADHVNAIIIRWPDMQLGDLTTEGTEMKTAIFRRENGG